LTSKIFLFFIENQNIKSSAMLDKKEERLLRISSFYPAKQLFILWFGFVAKKKFLRRKIKFIIFVWASLYKTMSWKYFTEIIYLVLGGIANKNLS
jgi:hypothetical protein